MSVLFCSNCLPQIVYRMVHGRYGVDILDQTMRVPLGNKRAWRYRKDGTVSKFVRSRAISARPRRLSDGVDFTYVQPNRHNQIIYEDMGVITDPTTGDTYGLGTRRRLYCKPRGYAPVIVREDKRRTNDAIWDEIRDNEHGRPLVMDTPSVFKEWSATILNQLHVWMKQKVVEYVGVKSECAFDWRELSHVWLGLLVEVSKPRVCVNGSIMKWVAPKRRPPCRLDSMQMLLEDLKPYDQLYKSDDKSGFSNHVMDPESADFLAIEFGDLMLRCKGMPFGILQAPAFYNMANRVCTNIVTHYGGRILLYIGMNILLNLIYYLNIRR